MTNFFLGLMAGCIIAGVVTITAARHPTVQLRLGLVPAAQAAVTPAPRPETSPRCPAPKATMPRREGRVLRIASCDGILRRDLALAPWLRRCC
jgi:hypothetical protein